MVTPAERLPGNSTPSLPGSNDRLWLLKTIFLHPRLTIPAAAMTVIMFLCTGLTPVIVGYAIDDAIAGGEFAELLRWLAVLVLVSAVHATCGWFGRKYLVLAMLRTGHSLRMAVTDRISHPRGLGGQRRTAGELLSIASSDTQRIADAVLMAVFPFAEFASIIYVGVMVSMISVSLGIAVLVGGPVMVWISLSASGPLRRRSGKRQHWLAEAAATATDVVHGLRILKGIGAVDTVYERYQQVSDDAYSATVRAHGARSVLDAITETIGSVYIIVIGIAAGGLALGGGHQRGRVNYGYRFDAIHHYPDDDAREKYFFEMGYRARVRRSHQVCARSSLCASGGTGRRQLGAFPRKRASETRGINSYRRHGAGWSGVVATRTSTGGPTRRATI